MALGNLGAHLKYDEDGDADMLLELPRYVEVSVYCALERADMDQNRQVFDQLLKGKRFKPLIYHMGVTCALGMEWNYFKNDVFITSNNVTYHVCEICKNFTNLKCPCKTRFYCSIQCQRVNWFEHKKLCSARK